MFSMRQQLAGKDLRAITSVIPKFNISYELTTNTIITDFDALVAVISTKRAKKCLAWFTTWKTSNICLIVELGADNRPLKPRACVASFSDALCAGTLVYGKISAASPHEFSIEDIYYYKGRTCDRERALCKFDIIQRMVTSEMSPLCVNDCCITFSYSRVYLNTPIDIESLKSANERDLFERDIILVYKSSKRRFRVSAELFNKWNSSLWAPASPTSVPRPMAPMAPIAPIASSHSKTRIFVVKASTETDIYHLFNKTSDGSNSLVFYAVAGIPSYSTSVMMNSLFRRIKENSMLDCLEESDDESEFEDPREDKFVDVNKRVSMKCVFNEKFKKWVPMDAIKQ